MLLSTLTALTALAAATPCCHVCPTGTAHYWANDKPNHECAESCLDTSDKLTMAEFWVLTGGQGKLASTTSPCASAGFGAYNRTDVIGTGPVRALTTLFHSGMRPSSLPLPANAAQDQPGQV